MQALRRKIRMFALHTRLFILILQFVCNWVIPDHKADAFAWPVDPAWQPTVLDQLVGFMLDGLVRWDGAHFLHIAHHGYTFETNLAFFPLYPLLIRTLATGLHWLQEDYAIISFVTSLKISSVLLSNAFFILATEALYDLSRKVLKDEYLAYKAALFFAINPANIFFTAPYSESLNALLTFYTLYKISKQFSAVTCITIAMASATRANSLLNIGFVVYNSLKIVATETILHVRMKRAKVAGAEAELSTTIANILGDAILPGVFNLVGCVGSFIVFQYFCFTNFCRVSRAKTSDVEDYVVEYGRRELLKVVGDTPSPWCHNEPPIAYSYIQVFLCFLPSYI
jgi:phosphatidylinositol glycan class V